MSFIDNLKIRFQKATGRIEKNWPVKTRIHEVRGTRDIENLENVDSLEDLDTQITYDRARTVVSEDGEQELELLYHGTTGIEVGYEYFKKRKDGKEEIELLKPDRNSFIPLQENIQAAGENFSIDKVHDIKNWKLWAEREYEQKTSVVEVDEENWWESQTVQALILFIGAGIFFVMLGIGYSKVVTQPILEKLNNLNQGLLPVLATSLRLRLGQRTR